MKLCDFYASLLESIGLSIEPNGEIWVHKEESDISKPVTVSNKILTLPTQENLMSGSEFWQTRIAFHPLSQSLIRKESEVFKKLRSIINVRIYTNLVTILETMANLCNGAYKDVDLEVDQVRFMATINAAGTVTDKTVKGLSNVLNVVTPDTTNRLVNLYLRKGKLNGKPYTRIASVDFPIYENTSNKPKIFDVAINSRASRDAILAMFQEIFPNSEIADHYSVGSNDLTAPNTAALLEAFAEIASCMNAALDRFGTLIPNAKDLYCDLDWVDGLTKFAIYRTEVPAQPGNEGEMIGDTGSNPNPSHADIAGAPGVNSIAPTAPQQPANLMAPLTPETPQAATQAAAPAATKVTASSSPRIGIPFAQAALDKKSKPSPFTRPAQTSGNQASSLLREQQSNQNTALMQSALERERYEYQMKQQKLQQQQYANQMMPQSTPQMMAPMMPQQANQPCQQFEQLTAALRQNPQMFTALQQRPDIQQILAYSPAACQAAMANPTLLSNPQMLQQIASGAMMNGGGAPQQPGNYSGAKLPARKALEMQKAQGMYNQQMWQGYPMQQPGYPMQQPGYPMQQPGMPQLPPGAMALPNGLIQLPNGIVVTPNGQPVSQNMAHQQNGTTGYGAQSTVQTDQFGQSWR